MYASKINKTPRMATRFNFNKARKNKDNIDTEDWEMTLNEIETVVNNIRHHFWSKALIHMPNFTIIANNKKDLQKRFDLLDIPISLCHKSLLMIIARQLHTIRSNVDNWEEFVCTSIIALRDRWISNNEISGPYLGFDLNRIMSK